MKVSVVATVLNNEDTVGELVNSLLLQSRKPDEIIMVDGGSKDGTVQKLQGYEAKYDFIHVLSLRANKAKGRNLGISTARYKIIAQIDGSCVAEQDWLENLLAPMKDKEVGVSAGFYTIVSENSFARALAPFIGITQKRLDHRSYLPTGRSLALRKSVWKKLGGYSEDLQWSGEDNLFNYKLLKGEVKIVRTPEARVFWYAPTNFTRAAKKIFAYTAGTAQTGAWRHESRGLAPISVNIPGIYLRYALALVILWLTLFSPFFGYVLLLGLTLFLFRSLWDKKEEVDGQDALMLVPIVRVFSEIVVISGFLFGLAKAGRLRVLPDVKYSKWGISKNRQKASAGLGHLG